MKFKPINKKIVVKAEAAKTMTDSGLHIPDSAQEKLTQGKVLSVADDCEQIYEGVTVLYGRYNGTQVEIEGEELLILAEKEILGYIEGELK